VSPLFQKTFDNIKSQRRHPFSFLMELISDAIVWDSSMRFSEKTFIRIMTWIMQIISANGLPTTGERQEFRIIL
jgi:hypothetical protein